MRRSVTGLTLCLLLTGCGSQLVSLPAPTVVAFGHRYAVALLVDRSCPRAKQMEASPGLGCGFAETFGTSALSFVRGSLRFEHRCHDIVSGQPTSESCVSMTMVSRGGGTWSSGTLHVYVRQHGRKLVVDDVEYGNGDSCFTPEFRCTTDRALWAQRVQR